MFKGKRTFGEFKESEEKISTNILADRLRRLEFHEIIEKTVAPDNRSSLIYSLTKKGADLLPIMIEITAWSAKHDALTNTPYAFLDAFETQKENMTAKLKSEIPGFKPTSKT